MTFTNLALNCVTRCQVTEGSCDFPFLILIFAVGVECGENRGRTGGNRGRPKEPGENRGHLGREPGENRGLLVFIYKEYRGRSGGFGTRAGGEPGGAQKNRGRTGGIWEENRGRTGGFWYSFTKSTGGEAGALGQEPGENRGEGIFFETRDPTRDLKINEQDRP